MILNQYSLRPSCKCLSMCKENTDLEMWWWWVWILSGALVLSHCLPWTAFLWANHVCTTVAVAYTNGVYLQVHVHINIQSKPTQTLHTSGLRSLWRSQSGWDTWTASRHSNVNISLMYTCTCTVYHITHQSKNIRSAEHFRPLHLRTVHLAKPETVGWGTTQLHNQKNPIVLCNVIICEPALNQVIGCTICTQDCAVLKQ